MPLNPSTDSFDAPDIEDQRIAERRLSSYSQGALKLALPICHVFVNHPTFAQALEAFDRAFQLGRELDLPQGVLLTGPPGSGKTSLIRYFCDSLPSSNLFETGMGAVAIRLPHRPSVGRLVSAMLQGLRYPFTHVSNRTLWQKRGNLMETLQYKGSRIIFVDEAHHLCRNGASADTVGAGTDVTDVLKEAMDKVRVAVVLLGTDSLDQLSRTDSALATRVVARVRLDNFSANRVWAGFVRAFVKQTIEFDLSYLASPPECRRLHLATDGNLRAFKLLVVEAVLVAFDQGRQALDEEAMRLAFDRVHGAHHMGANPYGG